MTNARTAPDTDPGEEQLLRREEPVGASPRIRTDRTPVVLAVDDEEDFLELTEMFLGDGFNVVKARSASEALDLALRHPPDVVFLDLRLPGASGFEVLKVLRSEAETRDIPIFACSGADIDDAGDVLRAGFDAHFPKPVNWSGLRQILRRLFGR